MATGKESTFHHDLPWDLQSSWVPQRAARTAQSGCENRTVPLERTFNDHQVQVPDHFRANQKLKHISEGIVQKSLEHWQAWGINYIYRKPGSSVWPEIKVLVSHRLPFSGTFTSRQGQVSCGLIFLRKMAFPIFQKGISSPKATPSLSVWHHLTPRDYSQLFSPTQPDPQPSSLKLLHFTGWNCHVPKHESLFWINATIHRASRTASCARSCLSMQC